MHHFLAVLVWVVLAFPVVAATPAERLLGPLLAEFTEHRPRCDWQAEHASHLERTLSLYRSEMTELVVELDGAPLRERAARVEVAVFETRLLGPATATVALAVGQPAARPRPGQRLAIQFEDRAGVTRPLFCGIVFAVRVVPRSDRTIVDVVQPRVGAELVRSRQFSELTRADVVRFLAEQAGVPIEVQDVRPRSTLASVLQQDRSDWSFMRHLATLDEMTLNLKPDGFRYANSSFQTPPSVARSRTWTDMRWTDVVAQLAAFAGLASDIGVTDNYPTAAFRQNHEDLAFAHELGARHERSVYLDRQRLLVRDDGAWRRDPSLVSQTWQQPVPEIAASIMGRHDLASVVHVPVMRAVRLRQQQRRDSEFLLQALTDAGLYLQSTEGGLRVGKSTAPGDVTDLLTLRAAVWNEASRPGFSRSHGSVRDQLLAPLEVPSTFVELRIPAGTGSLAAPPSRSIALRPALLPSASARGDLGAVARDLQQALDAARATAGSNARERFLLDLIQVYRPTVTFLHRIGAG